MLRCGTTLIEAKSGYGLDMINEIKMLKVIQQAHQTHPVDLVANYCGNNPHMEEMDGCDIHDDDVTDGVCVAMYNECAVVLKSVLTSVHPSIHSMCD